MNKGEQPASFESTDAPTPVCDCGYLRVVRAVIGTVLLTVMLGNLVAFASPEWAAALGSYLPACGTNSGNCAPGKSAGCCPGMTAIGLPTSVLESVVKAPDDEIQSTDVRQSPATP